MSKHTPGPWVVKKLLARYANFCAINTVDGSPVGESYEEKNARLIAAAPELLEALKEIANMGVPVQKTEHRIARAAIAKVKGGSSILGTSVNLILLDEFAEEAMSKHTPGPWEIKHHPDPSYRYISAPEHIALAQVVWCVEEEDRSPSCEANAHLIAAAPELLEALERVKATGVFLGAIPQEMVDAAIAKAKGS